MGKILIIDNPQREGWPAFLARPSFDSTDLDTNVRKILDDVKKRGDEAVDEYTNLFDQSSSAGRMVEESEFGLAIKLVPENLKVAIRKAKENIWAFHSNQVIPESAVETSPGIRCWRRSVGIEKVGLYIPGGTAPLFSTLLMLGVPASLAGCKEIIICTPPQKDGTVHPAILFTAGLLGIRKIFKVGGVQAIAAMAYGTKSIPRVYKIFGPGNQYVTQAKKIIQREGIAIDMPAGPSELAVYADETAVPDFVAADLLSQCEHGPDSQVVLVTNSRSFADQVNLSLALQLEKLPRKAFAEKSLENSRIFLIADPAISMELLNEYAPEHLILSCKNADQQIDRVRNAGSVFIGNYAPESAGDYASGTNHVLPTNGFATAYSGVSVDSFVKKISFQQLTEEGLRSIGNTVVEMATAEGLEAHAQAVRVRFEK